MLAPTTFVSHSFPAGVNRPIKHKLINMLAPKWHCITTTATHQLWVGCTRVTNYGWVYKSHQLWMGYTIVTNHGLGIQESPIMDGVYNSHQLWMGCTSHQLWMRYTRVTNHGLGVQESPIMGGVYNSHQLWVGCTTVTNYGLGVQQSPIYILFVRLSAITLSLDSSYLGI